VIVLLTDHFCKWVLNFISLIKDNYTNLKSILQIGGYDPIIRAISDQSDQSDGSSADIRGLFFFHPDDPFFDRMADRIDRIHPDRTSS
jgi:hypothetical protein